MGMISTGIDGRPWPEFFADRRPALAGTGPFTNLFEFPAVATAGQLFLLATPVRFDGDL
ncbi:hypothetical protein [Kitasatospora sp. MAP5-34]|uniref:hypothetical protein n=1 Tax=Kitasatospora sp. MAP5-34 TaxID=3035102 RepID=UPI002475F1E3|nr:hypothetical protein [Kitasatospora sp. MAP5-34]